MSPVRFERAGLEEYVEAHTSAPAAHLQALEAETRARLAVPEMLTGAVEGRFLEMLVWAAQPRLVLELGTYSGYSALSMAAALPPGGRIVSCEVSERHAEFARRHIEASPYADRIEVVLGPALDTIAALDGPFDLVFIDADKGSYPDYYEAVVPKLAPRGLIVIDNTLWDGDVVEPESENARALARLNDRIVADQRVAAVLLTVRDGVTLVRLAG